LCRNRGIRLVIVSAALFLAASLAAAQGLISLEGSYIVPTDDPAIRYREHGTRNAIARMHDRIASGDLQLAYDPKFGYLPGLLKALGVPVSSQVLVFSKTSFQAARIYPHNPRAVYFNDSVSIGHVPGTDLLELAASDPDAGVVFFTLSQHNTGTPELTRQDECLQCHAIPRTLGVPGLVVRSVSPDRGGMPVFRAGSYHRSSQPHRAALGWLVCHGHLGSAHGQSVCRRRGGDVEAAPESAVKTLGEVLLDTSRHLARTAIQPRLMVLEHQVR
jgi:hypothetical protein